MSLKTKLKQRKCEQIDLVFCLDRPLLGELAVVRAEDAADAEGRMSGGKSAKARELEKAVADASVTIRMFSLPWDEYNALMLEHPGRDGMDEQFDPSTFFAAAARATAVEVTATGTVPIPDDDWDEFVDGMTDGEYDRLANAVVMLNRNVGTVNTAPFV